MFYKTAPQQELGSPASWGRAPLSGEIEEGENRGGGIKCFHCLEEVPKYTNLFALVNGQKQAMCCLGCKSATEFIVDRGLARFYEHRQRLSQSRFSRDV